MSGLRELVRGLDRELASGFRKRVEQNILIIATNHGSRGSNEHKQQY